MSLRSGGVIATLGVAGVCSVLAALLFFPQRLHNLWLAVSGTLPESLRERGTSYLEQFTKGLDAVRDTATTLILLAQSFGRWLLASLLAWLSIAAYGDPIPFSLAMVVIGITAFAASLPSAPGFVGPIQAAFVFALTPFGVPQEVAFAASILFLLGHWIPVTAAGAIFLVSRRLSFAQLRREVDDQVSADAIKR
jgi:uncharacterized protein (TIRG00374 family)